jgi:hypothetical protein
MTSERGEAIKPPKRFPPAKDSVLNNLPTDALLLCIYNSNWPLPAEIEEALHRLEQSCLS